MSTSGKSVISNLIWKYAERLSAQLVTMVVSIIIARILDPEHYGTIALVTVFITFANVFVSDGFGSALIQKKDADIIDFSSVLFFNVALSIVLYIVLFFLAPFISNFYGEGYEILTPVMRVLGLRLILSAINSVQQAYVSRQMIFKKFFWATLFGTVLSGVVGIIMAYKGFGVWALVAQYLTNTTVDTIILQLSLNKWPKLVISFKRLKNLIGFGARVLFTNLVMTGYQELRTLVIGKLYSSSDLAFYNKGMSFPSLIVTNINSSMGAVLFPKMSQLQDDRERLKETTRMSVRFSSYLLMPLMLGLLSVAKPFVVVLLTEKWLPCVKLMQMLCIFYLFQPIHTANIQAIKAIGRSDIVLKLEIIRDVIQLVALVAVMWISVEAIVLTMAIQSVLFVFINGYPNRKLINYSYIEQIKDIFPSLSMATVMAISVILIGLLPLPTFPLLIVQVLSGAMIYILLSIITNNSEFVYIKRMVFETLHLGKNS